MDPVDTLMEHPIEEIVVPREYRILESCEVEIPQPCAMIIFGASGDLTKRKLMPSLYRLFKNNMLPEHFFIFGTSRDEKSVNQYRTEMYEAVKTALPKECDQEKWDEFAGRIYYATFEYDDPASYTANLKDALPKLEARHKTRGNRIYYLAIPPQVFEDVIHNLGAAGLAREEPGCSHIVIEKPFGRDLASARKLNRLVHAHYKEGQIFRIDHYLAKETVQNILMFRFANSIFEPLWNRRYIDHVQITASETLGIERRAGYYEESGVLRDMFQNHMFQLLALAAMEPPSTFEAELVRDERMKVLSSIRPFPLDALSEHIAVGQYGKGELKKAAPVVGYREEEGVAPYSGTPTYAAMKVYIDNWRWDGVPFFLRSGKRLATRKTEICIQYKRVPHSMFPQTVGGPIEPNMLVLNVQPDEGLSLMIQTKQPGSKFCLHPVEMKFNYPRGVLLDAYEWVVLDCMLGDHMHFTRQDAVEQTWALLSPVIERLEFMTRNGNIPFYTSGTDGPTEAAQLIGREGRAWRPL
jgi:glucose-6-phosphate 1-dehydrogenase